GTSKDLQVANAVSTLKGLLKSGLKLQLQDEVAEEELVLAVQLAAETSKHAQLVVSDEGMPSLMVPLGPLGEGNPLFEAMTICALAVIADAVAAGDCRGYELRACAVRGAAGCALRFRKAHLCVIL
ncbi:unnamed protein product, partial [Effrenium voratum]